MNTGATRSMKVTGKAIMLCSYGININVMANLMLVQCVIASHAGLVSFGGNSIRSCQWPWYRPRGYKTWVHSQTQNKVQWLAACGHSSASSQSLRFILSLRLNSSFITSRPGPRRNGSVNSRSTLCPIERRSCLPKTLLSALIWLFTFCKLSNFFWLDPQASKLY